MVGVFTNTIDSDKDKKYNLFQRLFRKIFKIKGSIKKKNLYFVHIPESISDNEEFIKTNFSRVAKAYAKKLKINKVYLLYGKEKTIVYDYTI